MSASEARLPRHFQLALHLRDFEIIGDVVKAPLLTTSPRSAESRDSGGVDFALGNLPGYAAPCAAPDGSGLA